jgi:DNA-binding protein HU-beta
LTQQSKNILDMTKQDLVTEISKKTSVPKEQVSNTVEAFMEVIKTSMANNQNIYFRGFGTFEVKKRAKKTARNISKGTTVVIPEHLTPTFKPCDEFKDMVKTIKVK